jgi:hypothetical protein
VNSMAKVAEIEAAEKMKMTEKVQKIISHGINCFIDRQLIYDFPEQRFADATYLQLSILTLMPLSVSLLQLVVRLHRLLIIQSLLSFGIARSLKRL